MKIDKNYKQYASKWAGDTYDSWVDKNAKLRSWTELSRKKRIINRIRRGWYWFQLKSGMFDVELIILSRIMRIIRILNGDITYKSF